MLVVGRLTAGSQHRSLRHSEDYGTSLFRNTLHWRYASLETIFELFNATSFAVVFSIKDKRKVYCDVLS